MKKSVECMNSSTTCPSTASIGRRRRGNESLCVLVTGSTDGIGRHTATKYAHLGPHVLVLLHGRSQIKLDECVKAIKVEAPDANLETFCFDLETLLGAMELCRAIKERVEVIDVLINNAGIFEGDGKIRTTSDHLERTFAVNVCAPFVILASLLPLVAASDCGGRVLNVSSISQGDIDVLDLADLQLLKPGRWNKFTSYGSSKLLMAMISHELALRITAVTPTITTSSSGGGVGGDGEVVVEGSDQLLPLSLSRVVVMSCDPGTVNTKMLIAGWGACGIPLEEANYEYDLTREYDPSKHGKYFVDCIEASCERVVYNSAARQSVWEQLENICNVKLL